MGHSSLATVRGSSLDASTTARLPPEERYPRGDDQHARRRGGGAGRELVEDEEHAGEHEGSWRDGIAPTRERADGVRLTATEDEERGHRRAREQNDGEAGV